MPLDADTLRKLNDLINVNDRTEHLDEINQLLSELNKEYIHASIRNYINKDRERLHKIEAFAERLEKILEKGKKSAVETMIHEMGVFKGANLLMYYLLFNMNELESVKRKVHVLAEQSHIKDILLYIYAHPGSRHKKIADALGLSTSHLSELMRKLEQAQCVERYHESKYSYYELTVDGKYCVREMFHIADKCEKKNQNRLEYCAVKNYSEKSWVSKDGLKFECVKKEKEKLFGYQRAVWGYGGKDEIINRVNSDKKADSRLIILDNKYHREEYIIEN